MNKLTRSALVAGMLAFGVAACGDDVTVVDPPPSPLSVQLSPSTIQVEVGSTVNLGVNVSGGDPDAQPSWECSSSNTGVATASSSGTGCEVQGVSRGTVTVTAQVTRGTQTSSASSEVRVVEDELRPATVSISSVNSNVTGLPVNLAAVVGQVDAVINVTENDETVTMVELVIAEGDGSNPRVVATQSFGSGVSAEADADPNSPQQITLSVNTAAADRDEEAHVMRARYFNGPKQFKARIHTVQHEEDGPSATNAVAATFANPSTFVVEVEADGNDARDATGRQWFSGGLSAKAWPLLYREGVEVEQLTMSVLENNFGAAVAGPVPATVSEAPYEVSWPASGAGGNNVGGIDLGQGIYVTVTGSVLDDGTTGPTGPLTTVAETSDAFLRLDNVAPNAGAFALAQQNTMATATSEPVLCCAQNWVGTDYNFSAGKTGHTDVVTGPGNGVGLPADGAVTFHVGEAGMSNSAIAATDPVETGADLEETVTNQELRAVAVVTDRLGNSSTVALQTNTANPQADGQGRALLGVDLTPPTIEFAGNSVANEAIFNQATGQPATNFQVSIEDASQSADAGPSGFGTNPVLARVDRWFSGLSAANRCLTPGVFHTNDAVCQLSGTTTSTAVPTSNGYHTYEAFVVDQAGNRSVAMASPSVSRVVLNDQTLPSASNIAIPSVLEGGSSVSFSADLSDDVNLWRVSTRVRYGGGDRIPFAAPAVLNDRFPSSLLTSHSHQASMNFVASLEMTTGADAPGGGMADASHVAMWVEDAAGNEFRRENEFQAGTVDASGTSFSDASRGSVQSFAITSPDGAVEVDNALGSGATCTDSDAPSTRTVTIQATGPSGTQINPFNAGLNLYRYDVNGDVQFVAAASGPSVTDDGTTRTWTWTATFDGTGLPAQTDAPIFAIGAHNSGDALQSQSNTDIDICDAS